MRLIGYASFNSLAFWYQEQNTREVSEKYGSHPQYRTCKGCSTQHPHARHKLLRMTLFTWWATKDRLTRLHIRCKNPGAEKMTWTPNFSVTFFSPWDTLWRWEMTTVRARGDLFLWKPFNFLRSAFTKRESQCYILVNNVIEGNLRINLFMYFMCSAKQFLKHVAVRPTCN